MRKARIPALVVIGFIALVGSRPAAAGPAEDRIDARYRADKAACERRADAREDVCEERAKGRREVAYAELEYRRSPTRDNAEKIAYARAKADYEVAKERCDRLSGREENRCERQAERNFERETARIDRRYGR